MEVGAWLERLGLGQYRVAFDDNAVDFDVLRSLTGDDLKEIGVTAVGHRRKLLEAIAALADGTDEQATQGSTIAPATEAERRQLSVMFCDLIGSTALSTRLDPEDMRALISAYHNLCQQIVERYGGFVAEYLGDGLLAYFGFPRSSEDDAERAILAGLALCEEIPNLKTAAGAPLEVRVGIATGIVVAGDLIGSGDVRKRGVIGDTPNLAARLQGVAAPGWVVIAEGTRRLVGGLFELEYLGPQDLKGIEGSTLAWNVVRPRAIGSRFEALRGDNLTALIGRDEEFELLSRRWAKAAGGEGQVVLVSGEAGIGKSRLTVALTERLSSEPHVRLRYFCSPQHVDSAFHPVISQLERAAGFVRDDPTSVKLDKLDLLLRESSTPPEDAGLIADMLALPNDGRYPKLELSPAQRRQKTLAALVHQIEILSREAPALLVFEDAHWVDPSSLELIGKVVDRIEGLRVLLVVTHRPDFAPPWIGRAGVTALTLNRLTRREIDSMIARVIGDTVLSDAMRLDIIDRADGVPLFAEEIAKAAVDASSDGDKGALLATIPMASHSVPPSLHATLMARLDRLGAAKQVAQVGSAIGREFTYDLLAAVAEKSGSELKSSLDSLVQSGLLFRQGAHPNETYLFKHALIQDAAYSTLLRETRRALHRRIALAVENSDGQSPEVVAAHFQAGEEWERALDHWQKAGEIAVARAAAREALSHFENAIDCFKNAGSAAGGVERFVRLHLAAANVLMQAEGYGHPRLTTLRNDALKAAANAGVTNLQCEVLVLCCSSFFATGRNQEYCNLVAEHTSVIPAILSSKLASGLNATVAVAHFNRGETNSVIKYCRSALEILDNNQEHRHMLVGGADPKIATSLYLQRALFINGYMDDAFELTQEIEFQLNSIRDPFHKAWATIVPCFYYELSGEYAKLYETADELIALSKRHDYKARIANGLIFRGIARAGLGDLLAGTSDVREGYAGWRGEGVVFHTPERACNLCHLLIRANQFDEVLQVFDDIDALVENTDEANFRPECLRMRGLAGIGMGDVDRGVQLLEAAVAEAKRREARLFELRALTNLASLSQTAEPGNRAAIRLRQCLDQFQTTREFVDLTAARTALQSVRVQRN